MASLKKNLLCSTTLASRPKSFIASLPELMPIQTSQVVVVPREPAWRYLAREWKHRMEQCGLSPEGALRAKNVDFGDRLSHEAWQHISDDDGWID